MAYAYVESDVIMIKLRSFWPSKDREKHGMLILFECIENTVRGTPVTTCVEG